MSLTEDMPQYGTGPMRSSPPEYFFVHTPEKLIRLRVPGLWKTALLAIIDSSQGNREHMISYDYLPGPTQVKIVSKEVRDYILRIATGEEWIE
ncbi:hypothetical protein DLD82_04215 [Methanospirillum stamsii]|uniref:Uncharacterized protein n=1 Tax=Methanospirillum stamsii TaxID=1277351 RepID=A0A2V2NCL0_9EURY|nr:hypothetical protein DLD82_04215 [Methanospirillum stamsii]